MFEDALDEVVTVHWRNKCEINEVQNAYMYVQIYIYNLIAVAIFVK